MRGSRIVRSTRLRGVDGRAVVADFDGGEITSNAGGLLLGATDRAIGLVERFAACFTDGRAAERVVHEVARERRPDRGGPRAAQAPVDHDRWRAISSSTTGPMWSTIACTPSAFGCRPSGCINRVISRMLRPSPSPPRKEL
ncbi:MAG TPA: transposase [Amaricoccus sp.]|nr:transposase [Amaricoccus sp.]